MIQLLSEDVTMWADGGGKARGVATRPIYGRAAVAQFVIASLRLLSENARIDVQEVNGESAIVLRAEDRAVVLIFVKAEGTQVTEVWAIGNLDKLQRI